MKLCVLISMFALTAMAEQKQSAFLLPVRIRGKGNNVSATETLRKTQQPLWVSLLVKTGAVAVAVMATLGVVKSVVTIPDRLKTHDEQIVTLQDNDKEFTKALTAQAGLLRDIRQDMQMPTWRLDNAEKEISVLHQRSDALGKELKAQHDLLLEMRGDLKYIINKGAK